MGLEANPWAITNNNLPIMVIKHRYLNIMIFGSTYISIIFFCFRSIDPYLLSFQRGSSSEPEKNEVKNNCS